MQHCQYAVSQKLLTDSEIDESDPCEGRLVIDLSNSGSSIIDVVSVAPTPYQPSSSPKPQQPETKPPATPTQSSQQSATSSDVQEAYQRWWLPNQTPQMLQRQLPQMPPMPQGYDNDWNPWPLNQELNSSYNSHFYHQHFQQLLVQQQQQQLQQQQHPSQSWAAAGPQSVCESLCACVQCASRTSSAHYPTSQLPPLPPTLPPSLPPPPPPRHYDLSMHVNYGSPYRSPMPLPPMKPPPSKPPGQGFKCGWCSAEPFYTSRLLSAHIERVHRAPDGGACGICGAANVGSGHSRQHAAECLSVSGLPAFLCNGCDSRIFASKGALRRHFERKHNRQ